MLGDRKGYSQIQPDHDGGHMSLKAAEAGMLINFVVELLLKHGGINRFGMPLIVAGQSLARCMCAMREIDVIPTNEQYIDMKVATQMHLT
eukprot:3622240-Pyramimonas_sp.AAC.1